MHVGVLPEQTHKNYSIFVFMYGEGRRVVISGNGEEVTWERDK